MPVEPKVINGKVRTVESASGHIAKTPNGKPRDGGGWSANRQGWGSARRQAEHINEHWRKKH